MAEAELRAPATACADASPASPCRLTNFGSATAASTPPPALAQAATPASTVGGDWTQFHNDRVHSGYNAAETTISAANVANLGVAWTATTGDLIECGSNGAASLIFGYH